MVRETYIFRAFGNTVHDAYRLTESRLVKRDSSRLSLHYRDTKLTESAKRERIRIEDHGCIRG